MANTRRIVKDRDRRLIHRYAKTYSLSIIRLNIERRDKNYKDSPWEVVFYAKTPDGYEVRITEYIWSRMTRYTPQQFINPNEYFKEYILRTLGLELIVEDDAPPLRMRDKVTLRCPVHGEYEVTLKVPYYGKHGCAKCNRYNNKIYKS